MRWKSLISVKTGSVPVLFQPIYKHCFDNFSDAKSRSDWAHHIYAFQV